LDYISLPFHIFIIFLCRKPTTFATIIRGSKTTYFFALPGNPVSAMVTFYLFVLPAIRKLAGFKKPHLQRIQTRVSLPLLRNAMSRLK